MDTNIDLLNNLQNGEIKLKGEFIWGSNYTFLVRVGAESSQVQAVYKPSRGVRPLWDFPTASLALRETAAYIVSEMLGWSLVPPTVYREDGPLGAGSLQLFVEHNPEYHFFNFSDEDRQQLRKTVVFDELINNADRKGSHILVDPDQHLWLIDHGVCFHVQKKLRTVIWDFVGESIPIEWIENLRSFADELESSINQETCLLANCLNQAELIALIQRAREIAYRGFFPAPDPHRRSFPWPEI